MLKVKAIWNRMHSYLMYIHYKVEVVAHIIDGNIITQTVGEILRVPFGMHMDYENRMFVYMCKKKRTLMIL